MLSHIYTGQLGWLRLATATPADTIEYIIFDMVKGNVRREFILKAHQYGDKVE